MHAIYTYAKWLPSWNIVVVIIIIIIIIINNIIIIITVLHTAPAGTGVEAGTALLPLTARAQTATEQWRVGQKVQWLVTPAMYML